MGIIFYAVGGEGMGHATRSEAVIKHLLLNHHKLIIFSYDRAFDYLNQTFKTEKNVLEIIKITGINFIYEENEFKLKKTIIKESKKIPSFLIKNIAIFLNNILKYNPSVIITDFEPISNNIARILSIPLICIDNLTFLTKCQIDNQFKNSIGREFNKKIINNYQGDYNFITTIFDVPLKQEYINNTYLVGPIIRDCFNNIKVINKNFILVYQTSKSNNKLFKILKQTSENYIIYGFNKEGIDNNLTFKKPSKKEFAKDLINCKAVITNGGFTLISEAVTLKKPIYSIPVLHQIEQEINGYYINKFKWGVCSKEINKKDLKLFLNNLEEYGIELVKLNHHKNDLFRLLDKKIKYLIGSYKKPSRLKRITQVKNIYDTLVQRLLNLIYGDYEIKNLISSSTHLITKSHLFSRLDFFKTKKKEIRQSKDINQILNLKLIEKYLKLNKDEKISYSIYTSAFKSNKQINLVFLHGLGGNKSVFIDLIIKMLKLSKEKINFKIILIDLAGHGKSTNFKSLKKYNFLNQSKYIKKIINKELGEQSKIDLVGHCFGSFIAIKLTNLLEKRVKHLFLISSNPFLSKSKEINFKIVQNKVMQKTLKLLFKNTKFNKTLINYDYKEFKKSSDYNARRIFLDIKNTSLKGYFASLYYLSFNSIEKDFQELLQKKTKIVMIHGKKDKIFPYENIKKEVKNKNIKLVSLSESNHLPVFNSRGELVKIILSELK